MAKRKVVTPLRNAQQKEQRGMPPGANKRRQNAPREGLNRRQERMVRQRERGDIALGAQANQMLPQVQEAYQQPFDFGALPEAPVSGDFKDWRQGQIDEAYNLFESRFAPQFEQQKQDLEQQLYNRGIPVGSPLYNDQMAQLSRQQNDARQSALVNAQGIAGQNAAQFFDIGQQARGSALSEGLLGRNMPLSEYAALLGAQSGLGQQYADYGMQRGLQQQQADLQLRNAQQAPRGGGGALPQWQQYGFGSPIEYDAYRANLAREQQAWEFANNPSYRQPKQPSTGASLFGQIAGAGINALGNYFASRP